MKRFNIILLAIILLCTFSLQSALAENVLTINLKEASDDELTQAVNLIKAEQRIRLKAKILLTPEEIIVPKGSAAKITASLIDLPEGISAGAYNWTSKDKDIAVYDKDSIKGINSGSTIITCSSVLSDGTEVSTDCIVKVIVPIKSISSAAKKMEVMATDTFIPEVIIKPDDATITNMTYESADESVVKVADDGQLYAVAAGTTTVTINTTDGSNKNAKVKVTVTKKIGKYDGELTYQNLEWGSSDKDCAAKLTELGIIDKSRNYSAHQISGLAYLWPENELLFNSSKWNDLPVIFSDLRAGTSRMDIQMLKSIGGFEPQSAILYFTNGINSEGQIDTNINQLAGVYFRFDTEHEKGTDIFITLITKFEEQYGEFTRYIHKSFSRRSNKEIYNEISGVMNGATVFNSHSVDKDTYLSTQATCILHGKNNTGIMLCINSTGRVTLFYGKTDVWNQIRLLQEKLESMKEIKEDGGI